VLGQLVEGARRQLKRKMSCRLPIGEVADRDDYAESHAVVAKL